MEGSRPAVPAEPGTLKASLVAMPGNTLSIPLWQWILLLERKKEEKKISHF